MRHLSYSNVVASIALFVALGGSAVALEGQNSVNSGDIQNGAVKTSDINTGAVKTEDLNRDAVTGGKIEAGAVKSSDVADGKLTGGDVEDGSLTEDDVAIGDFTASSIPVAGVLPAQARAIGGDGDTTFGPIAGRATASASMDDVQMAVPSFTLIANLTAVLPDELGVTESRTFTVVHRLGGSGAVVPTSLSCTIRLSADACSVFGSVRLLIGELVAVRIESTGAGLDPNEDAYIALSAQREL
jgi:hypothetical protein